jgi:hypothetical protein
MIVDGTGGTNKSRKKNNIPLAPPIANGFMMRSNDSVSSLQGSEENYHNGENS